MNNFDWRLYIRCFIANKFTLAGSVTFIVGIYKLFIENDLTNVWSYVFFGTGLLTLWLTNYGLETYNAYHNTLQRLSEGRRPHESMLYCGNVGLRLAANDFYSTGKRSAITRLNRRSRRTRP